MRTLSELHARCAQSERRVIGLMSGMSMDGVDLALVHVRDNFAAAPRFDLEDTFFQPYSSSLRRHLKQAIHGNPREASSLNMQVARMFAACVNSFLERSSLESNQVLAIGSHGQTIAHHPPSAGDDGSSLQLGSISVIAELTGIVTVGNFRQRDIAVGGQGAPLIPLAEWLWFAHAAKPLALHNLGSISNVTLLTEQRDDVLAFDTGPANQMLDALAAALADNQHDCDKDGRFSAQGTVDQALLATWLKHPFFAQPPPKSLGYAEFGATLIAQGGALGVQPVDQLRTAVELCAVSVQQAYQAFVLPRAPELLRVLVSGGGVHNPTLMQTLSEKLGALGLELQPHQDSRLTDFKEAAAFAVLANETLSGRPGNLPTATGAARPVICGEIAL